MIVFIGNKINLHNELKEKVIDKFIEKNQYLFAQINKLNNEISIAKKINQTHIQVKILYFI